MSRLEALAEEFARQHAIAERGFAAGEVSDEEFDRLYELPIPSLEKLIRTPARTLADGAAIARAIRVLQVEANGIPFSCEYAQRLGLKLADLVERLAKN